MFFNLFELGSQGNFKKQFKSWGHIGLILVDLGSEKNFRSHIVSQSGGMLVSNWVWLFVFNDWIGGFY